MKVKKIRAKTYSKIKPVDERTGKELSPPWNISIKANNRLNYEILQLDHLKLRIRHAKLQRSLQKIEEEYESRQKFWKQVSDRICEENFQLKVRAETVQGLTCAFMKVHEEFKEKQKEKVKEIEQLKEDGNIMTMRIKELEEQYEKLEQKSLADEEERKRMVAELKYKTEEVRVLKQDLRAVKNEPDD